MCHRGVRPYSICTLFEFAHTGAHQHRRYINGDSLSPSDECILPSDTAEHESVVAAPSPSAGSGGCPVSPSSCPAPPQPPPPGDRGRHGGTGACDWPLRCTACRGPAVTVRQLWGGQQVEQQHLGRKELWSF